MTSFEMAAFGFAVIAWFSGVFCGYMIAVGGKKTIHYWRGFQDGQYYSQSGMSMAEWNTMKDENAKP
jgi:hypothetical protein